MSKTDNSNKATATTAAAAPADTTMTAEEATVIILAPYVTEKTFNQIEKENKLSFMVADQASKHQIIEAMRILYETEVSEVNTARTIQGKKAFVKFKEPEGARNLATKLGLV
ncbi:LSU ribosomal protein L23P [Candidatus Nitrososphaera evergladensis SR1]|jgi:large subunit ribosomal protein L23|uniref:Large ribosomal subunit protein uL23 n=1 Tax=Candidatus Nitrososphaera evergladensis SR1 TaxID=1459636 RepID=A0A075MX69_9ARCH|nr:50S ribosomal protein L23 [Candidatus Nitrososphaera evergladensis]AIF83894.1 LSU ribosomal protein L23P [Candidatus Nitrososphaera evergladensis SR1]